MITRLAARWQLRPELRSIALAKDPAAMAKAMGMATEAGRLNLCAMNKPDFQSMSQKELQAYVLANRNDQEAFHAYKKSP